MPVFDDRYRMELDIENGIAMKRRQKGLATPRWSPPLLLVLAFAVTACSPFWCSEPEPADPPWDGGPDADSDGDADSDTGTGSDTDWDDPPEPCDFECMPYQTCISSGGTWTDGDCYGDDVCCYFDPDTDTDTETDPPEDTAIHAEDGCDPEAEYDYLLAVEDSNDYSSPTNARGLINDDWYVHTEIRKQTFLNYHSFGYAEPDPGYVNVTADLLIHEDADPLSAELQIGVRGEPISNDDRRPLNIVFSLDLSGSLGGYPFVKLQAVCTAIASNLKSGDVVSIVKWSNTSAVLLDSHDATGPDDPTLLAVIEDLDVGGSTDLYAGLAEAYSLALWNFTVDRANRVVLISDGQVSAGINELDLIAEMAEDTEEEGIYLLGVSVGDGYDDVLMDDVTASGRGPYLYLDTPEEAEAVFGDPDRFLSTIEIAARDVTLDLTMPAGWYISEYHGPLGTPEPSGGEPQHLWANEEMIFHYLLSPCGPVDPFEAGPLSATVDFLTGTGPYEAGSETIGFSFSDFTSGSSNQMIKGRAVLLYADTLEQIQTLMYYESEYPAIQEIIDEARASIQEATTSLGGDEELEEIDVLLETYRSRFE